MTKFFFLFTLLLSFTAHAAIKPFYQDIKLPTQVVAEKQSFGTPVAASTNDVVSAAAGPTGAGAASITSFLAQPDVPRNLVITPGGTTADVGTCTVTVTGTNFYGTTITEAFAFADNASTATTGAKAFKALSSVAFAAGCEDGTFAASWSVGRGEKIGLKRCLGAAGDWISSSVAGAYETTRATIAASATAIESNTADFNGTMNGSNAFTGYFYQNYRCGN